MEYDPIKDRLGAFFNQSTGMRKLFYRLLDLLLLRSWHIHKEFRGWMKGQQGHVQLLDAGSGFGQYSFWIAGKYPQVTIKAVDVKEDYLNDCRQFFSATGRTNVTFEVADLTKFTHPTPFDGIICVDVMEHILEDEDVFKNFNQVLKPGGMVLISTPSDQGGSDVHGDADQSFIGEHVRDGYNMQDITDKLKRAGFSKIEARYAYGTPGKISWRLSMKYPIQCLNVSKLFFVLVPFYYVIVYPFCYVLNAIDTTMTHKTGTGLIVKAYK